MTDELVEVYLTKYALSSGIRRIKVRPDRYASGKISGWAQVYDGRSVVRSNYFLPCHCQETKNDATARVEFMIEHRRKAIANELRKLDQIEAKLAKGELPMDLKFKGKGE